MKGIELSERFFHELVLPALRIRFPEHTDTVSAAIIGDGSEVLGYDDPISHDHNFSPRVALFLPDATFDRLGETWDEHVRRELPRQYAGFTLLWTEFRKALQVLPLRRHFREYLGIRSIPCATTDWLRCDEQKLLELTAGKIFHDPSGQLADMRAHLSYYPPGVRLYLLYVCFTRMSECAAIERAIRREDWLGIHHYVSYFILFAIKTAHLIQKRYCPYHKWMGRSLQELGRLGAVLHARIQTLVSAHTPPAVREAMLAVLVELGTQVTTELRVPVPALARADGLALLGFDWDAVLRPLSREMPRELRDLSPLISPPSYLGLVFDYTGYGGTYEKLLDKNLKFLRGEQMGP
jgi:hypothetical protein